MLCEKVKYKNFYSVFKAKSVIQNKCKNKDCYLRAYYCEIHKCWHLTKDFTQERVCFDIKLTQTYLSQIESGKKVPSAEILQRICSYYNIPYQVVVWKSIDKKDIAKRKLKLFNAIQSPMNDLIADYFNEFSGYKK